MTTKNLYDWSLRSIPLSLKTCFYFVYFELIIKQKKFFELKEFSISETIHVTGAQNCMPHNMVCDPCWTCNMIVRLIFEVLTRYPACIYLLQVNNEKTRAIHEICSKFTIKTRERNVIEVILLSLLLTFNWFHSLLYYFHCWHWAIKKLGNYKKTWSDFRFISNWTWWLLFKLVLIFRKICHGFRWRDCQWCEKLLFLSDWKRTLLTSKGSTHMLCSS